MTHQKFKSWKIEVMCVEFCSRKCTYRRKCSEKERGKRWRLSSISKSKREESRKNSTKEDTKESSNKRIKASNNMLIKFKSDKEKINQTMPLNKSIELGFMRVRSQYLRKFRKIKTESYKEISPWCLSCKQLIKFHQIHRILLTVQLML